MNPESGKPQRVYLTHDPGREGITTGKSRERLARLYSQVRWDEGSVDYVPQDQLTVATEEVGLVDALDLLGEGRLGDVSNLRRVLTHERLSGRLADIIYSMDTTGTDFYAFQFKPLLKLLNSATDGILIADEVGLGKTIEAGLIWTEFRQRFDFRKLMVVCPAMLREKWKRELINRFGVDADIVDSKQCLERFNRSTREGFRGRFAMIGSMQGLRPRKKWATDKVGVGAAGELARFLRDQENEEPLVDLTIIDEAHYLRNSHTMTNLLARLLRGVSQYVVLLSATPIHLRSEDLFQLLHLVDEDTFDHVGAFKAIMEASRPLVLIRDLLLSGEFSRESLLEDLKSARLNPLLRTNRQLGDLISHWPTEQELADKKVITNIAGRLEVLNPLGHVVSRTRKKDVKERRVVREVVAEEIPLAGIEMEVYDQVTTMVREYCLENDSLEGFLLVTPQRQLASSMPAALMHWEAMARDLASRETVDSLVSEALGIELGIDDGTTKDMDEPGPLSQSLARRVHELGDLDDLIANDSKYERLIAKLKNFFSIDPGTKEKVVIFAYFRMTLDYLSKRLGEDGIESFVLKGGIGDKDQLIDEFQNYDGSAVLLSSEVGSEGIDLQFCRLVINYDLPWNPMKVEQRIGRIDRLGQKADQILIWNLFSKGTIDSRIYTRLFARLKIFEETLGALEQVLGDQIRKLSNTLMSGQLSVEQEIKQIEATALALENQRQAENELEEKASEFIAYGDFILNEVNAAKSLERTISARDLRAYVVDHFSNKYSGCAFHQSGEDPFSFEVSLSPDAKYDMEEFIKKEQITFPTALIRTRPPKVPCLFKNSAVSKPGDKVEMISQFHPIVRFVTWQLGQKDAVLPHPAIALRIRISPDSLGMYEQELKPGNFVFAVQHWSVSGIQNLEKLYYVVAPLDDSGTYLSPLDSERLLMAGVKRGKDWIGFEGAFDYQEAFHVANNVCMAQCEEEYTSYISDLRFRNEDRVDIQLGTLDKGFQSKREGLSDRILRHREKGQFQAIKMMEGQLRALTERVERRKRDLETKRMLRDEKKDVCVGVIQVEIGAAGGGE